MILENLDMTNNIDKSAINQEVSIDEKTNLLIQVIVDGYLRRKGQERMDVLLKKEGLETRKGLLYAYHIQFLQLMIQEELAIVGVDLAAEVAKSGEVFKVGKLSTLENNLAKNLANNVVGIIDIVREGIENKA